jgi:hypothetical protein
MAMDLLDDDQILHVKLPQIPHVFRRDSFHQATVLEIQLRDGSSYFLHFAPTRSDELAQLFGTCDLVTFKMSELSDQWLARKLSNFDYLMHLNIMAGRSFDDVTHWSVMPNSVDREDFGKPTPLERKWDAAFE